MNLGISEMLPCHRHGQVLSGPPGLAFSKKIWEKTPIKFTRRGFLALTWIKIVEWLKKYPH